MTLPFQNGLRPVWPAPPQVQALMTDRHGGVSQAPWDSMNVGDHVGDSLQNTRVNRQLLRDAIGTRPVFLNQVHGVQSVLLDTSSENGTQADACISVASGVACTIMVADCLPVLLTNTDGTAVAAAHAGWRGLAGGDGKGVLEATFATFKASNRPSDQSIRAQAATETIAFLTTVRPRSPAQICACPLEPHTCRPPALSLCR